MKKTMMLRSSVDEGVSMLKQWPDRDNTTTPPPGPRHFYAQSNSSGVDLDERAASMGRRQTWHTPPPSPWPSRRPRPSSAYPLLAKERRRIGFMSSPVLRIVLGLVTLTISIWVIVLSRKIKLEDAKEHVLSLGDKVLGYGSSWIPDQLHVTYEGRHKSFDKMLVMNYPEPQDSLKAQFKPGVRYITAMSYGGHANQFLSIQNLLYLAKIQSRVAIIPTLTPIHFVDTPRELSAFYNVDEFYRQTEIPAVEMTRFKYWNLTHPPQAETFSCWSLLEATMGIKNGNDGSLALHNIDVQYWPLPPSLSRGSEWFKIWFEAIREFDFDVEARTKWIKKVRENYLPQKEDKKSDENSKGMVTIDKTKNVKEGFDPENNLDPESPLLCLDCAFFLGSHIMPPAYPVKVPLEPLRSYEGHGWIEVGQYLRFTQPVEDLADYYITQLFEVSSISKVPPLITVHIRRGDFEEARGLTGIEQFIEGVKAVRAKIRDRMDDPDSWDGAGKGNEKYVSGYKASQYAVLVTTDEPPESDFVKELKSMGWKVVDHDAMGTIDELGEWYPTVIDSAILARGAGFVGTEWSTFSFLAGLRVKYWNGGVEWFTPSLK